MDVRKLVMIRHHERVVPAAGVITAFIGFATLAAYVAFGHALIEILYSSNLPIVSTVLEGRRVTRLEDYFASFDNRVLLFAVVAVVTGLLVFVCSKDPLGVFLSSISFFVSSFLIFCLLDIFPALVKPLHFDVIPYFNFRLTYVADPTLGYRERPYHQAQITNFRGSAYSPWYGIDVSPTTITWRVDDEGFRNDPKIPAADIAIIGGSFPEYGNDLEDTYPKRLEAKLGGLRVKSFAKAGYGPFQDLEVLKRYVVKKKPQYVLFAFYAAGDIDERLRDHVTGQEDRNAETRRRVFGGLFERYGTVLQQTRQILAAGCWTPLELGFQRVLWTESVNPNIALLRLPNNVTERMLFIDHHSPKSVDDLLSSPEWRALEKILIDFKHISEQNQIVPLLVYIPMATEIYAEYSTSASGANWLQVRNSQIATSGNNEEAARRLARKIGVELISFLPAFKDAGRQGKLVYYNLDVHWNSTGREIAAKVTADALRALRSQPSRGPKNKKSTHPEKDRRLDQTLQEAMLDRRDGVMVRSLGGKINYWNPGAQRLYGWSKDEAIGRVSHNLLRTQFPEPLAKIDAELVQTGEWHGKLVHATRDGRRVVVESRWVLDRKEHPDTDAVVEINRPIDLSSISPGPG